MDNESVVCPQCDSSEVDYIPRRGGHSCANCNHFFKIESEAIPLRIFLSYGHDEKSFIAVKLKKELETLGHEVWYDSEKLQCSDDWENHIERGLEWVTEVGAYGRFLLLMTPHSLRRPDGFCLNELTRAMERQIPIFPVMIEWIEPPLSICRLQWLDFRFSYSDKKFTDKFDNNFSELSNALLSNKNNFDGSLQRLRTILEPVAFEASSLVHLRRFVGRRWVVSSIESWLKNENGDKVFWIVGGPGSGKSALASWLQYNRPYIKSFFLCKAAITGSNGHGIYEPGDPRWCVRTIAYQLCSMLPDYRDRLVRLDLERITKENSAESMFEKLITEELYGIQFEEDGKVIALIDGLDEITKEGKNELVEFLAKHIPNTPDWLRFIITSRHEEPLIGALQRYKPYHLDNQKQLNLEDQKHFIEKEFKVFESRNKLDDKMQHEIISKSEGNFLYLEQLRDSLERGYLSLDNVENFPQGLGEFYRSYFARKFTDIKYFRDQYYLVLAVMAAVASPLRIEEAELIFKWDKGYEVKDFKNNFGALCRYENERFKFYHQSLMEWVTSEERSGNYWVRVDKGYEYIAKEGYAAFQKEGKELDLGELKCIRELPECLIKLDDYEKLFEFLTDVSIFVNHFGSNIFLYISYWNKLCREERSTKRTLGDCVKILSEKVSIEKYQDTDNETWKGYLSIARLFFQLNEYEEGAQMYLKALPVLPANHEAEKGHIYNDIGECYLRLERYNDVEPNYKMALGIRRDIYETHPDLAESINNYGHIYFVKGQYDKALAQYEEAYAMWLDVPNGPHFGEADSLNNIAMSLRNLGRDEEAKAAYEKGVKLLDTTRSTNPFAVICWNNYGEYLEILGQFEEAGDQFRKAYDLLMKLYGPDYEPSMEQANKLAFFYFNTGNPDKAISLFSEVEEACSRIFGKNSLKTMNALLLIGEALLHSGNANQAIPIQREILERLNNSEENVVSMKGRAQFDLATSEYRSGNFETALDLAKKSIEQREIVESAGHYDTIKSYVLVIDCCNSLNQIESMKEYIYKCREKHIKEIERDSNLYYEFIIHTARALRLSDCWSEAKRLYEEVIENGGKLIELLGQNNSLKDNRIFNISVANNELAFYEFQPKCMWPEAIAKMEKAVKLMQFQDNEQELANMHINLNSVKHYAGLPIDLDEVKGAYEILQNLDDLRAEKAIELLGE